MPGENSPSSPRQRRLLVALEPTAKHILQSQSAECSVFKNTLTLHTKSCALQSGLPRAVSEPQMEPPAALPPSGLRGAEWAPQNARVLLRQVQTFSRMKIELITVNGLIFRPFQQGKWGACGKLSALTRLFGNNPQIIWFSNVYQHWMWKEDVRCNSGNLTQDFSQVGLQISAAYRDDLQAEHPETHTLRDSLPWESWNIKTDKLPQQRPAVVKYSCTVHRNLLIPKLSK